MEESFGKYVLLSRLGYGGMAEVFLARTDGIGGFAKLLAIKRLLPYYTEDAQTVELLADEAKITVRLTHPNIVQVFDFGRVDDHYFIAMEYVEGLDLKSLVEIDDYTSEPLPLEVAQYVTISTLEALDYAHNRTGDDGSPLKIIHRDVSPQNLLISRHGQVKLTDFGVARAAISSHVSMIGDIRGKFSYMPPEQACGGEIDHRIDIFAAGAVLYELLTGKQPFRSTSSGQQMELLHKNITPPSELRPEIPPQLDEITLRSLALSAADRFSSASAFAEALSETMDSLSDPRAPKQRLAELVVARLTNSEREAAVEAEPMVTAPNHLPPAPLADGLADPTLETKLSIPMPRESQQPADIDNEAATLLDMQRRERPAPSASDDAPQGEVPIGMAPTQLMDDQALAILPVDSLEEQATIIKRPDKPPAKQIQQPVEERSAEERWAPQPDDFPARERAAVPRRFPVRMEQRPPERVVERTANGQIPRQHSSPTDSAPVDVRFQSAPEKKPRSSALHLTLIFGGLILVFSLGVLLAIWVANA